MNSEAAEELECLSYIYLQGELQVTEGAGGITVVTVDLVPIVAENEQICVRASLQFTLPPQYPHSVPGIAVLNSRGLDDHDLEQLKDVLDQRAAQVIGAPMLFELIQVARDTLTENNKPKGLCSVCLDPFHSQTPVHKTVCFHFFHRHCLASSVRYFVMAGSQQENDGMPNYSAEKKVPVRDMMICPVCRARLDDADVDELNKSPDDRPSPSNHGSSNSEAFQIPAEILQVREKMSKLFLEQRQKGGIIDITENQRRLVVDSSTFISIAPPTAPPEPQPQPQLSSKGKPTGDGQKGGPKPAQSKTTQAPKRPEKPSHPDTRRHGKGKDRPKLVNDVEDA